MAIAVLVTGVVVAATHAEGRTIVRTDTNDGGAWLIRRSEGVVGHMNRAVREVSGFVSVSSPGAEFDVEQSDGRVLVNDRSAHTMHVVDPRVFQVTNRIDTGAAVSAASTPGGAVAWTDEPAAVWRLGGDELGQLESLAARPADVTLDGAGLTAVTVGGGVWVVDRAGGAAGWMPTDAEAPRWHDIGDAASSAAVVTTVGDVLAIVADDGAVTMVQPDGSTESVKGLPPGSALGVAAPAGSPLAAVTPDGRVATISPGAPMPTEVGSAGGDDPIAPIAHQGCVFAVVRSPATFVRSCKGQIDQTTPLEGTSSGALRLRLVNGWVWLNDLDSGAAWVASTEGEIERIDDLGKDLSNNEEGDPDSDIEGDVVKQRNNPDASEARLEEADQIDEDNINEPPVANDDADRTRADTPVIVRVLANDTDPDGDVLMVSAVGSASGEAVVTPTADRSAVQVQPAPGFTGDVTFDYTISDGRGLTATANVVVGVSAADGVGNRAPDAVTDVAQARAGASATFNVLENDSDPDGDAIVLQSVAVDSGAVVFDPSGRVTLTPDPVATSGAASATYVVADSFGATTEGSIRVDIRLDGSNNEPDARNDSAATVVGKPVSLNVLVNDTDPDNDPISVESAPTVVNPPNLGVGELNVSLSDDGEFFFLPASAGSFVFRYGIIDGNESDDAVIRVDVEEPVENRPPVVVRDDVTVTRGGSSVVYVLQNDRDPDGDVVALTGWTAAPGVEVEQVQGTALKVSAAADAPSEVRFNYTASDGQSEPVSGSVVVSVSSLAAADQAPIARPDIVEVRAGRSTAVQVLANDYDPEGTPFKVDSVSSVAGAQVRIGPGGQVVYLTVDPTTVAGFSFGYDIVDQAGNRSASVVQVRLVPDAQPNRPPIARADVARTRAGAPIGIAALANDSDPDGDPLRIESIAAQPAAGTAELADDGTITYTPADGFSGTDSFRYMVVDAAGERTLGEVLVGVMPDSVENVPPTATDDEFSVVAGGDPLQLDVLSNDNDPDGDALRIATANGNASSSVDDDRTHLRFDPPDTISGPRQVSTVVYSVTDGHGGADTATVTIEVVAALTPVPPVAVDDVVGPVKAGTTVAYDVVANDIDPDGARAQLVPSSADPSVAFGADGKAQITAGLGTSNHAYTVTDATGETAAATITVIVVDNLAPTAPPLRVETPAGQPVTVDVGAVATDPDGDAVFFTCCDNVRGGATEVAPTSAGVLSVTFTPDSGFVGSGAFSYTANDQRGHIVAGAVIVAVVAPANSPPAAADVSGSVEAGTIGSVSLADAVTDPDAPNGDTFTFELLDGPSALSVRDAQVQVDAPLESGGTTLSARYRVTDRAGASAEAALTVEVLPSQAPPPTAVADTARTTQNAPVAIDVVANDIDPLSRGLTVVDAQVSGGQGTAAVGPDARTITFTPATGAFGPAAVTYTVQDGRATVEGQAIGQLSVETIGFPDPPSTPQATAQPATATVTWSLGAANGSPIDDVEVRVNGGDSQSVGVTSSHTFQGLDNGALYTFEVRSHNEAGWSLWSQPSAPVTPDIEPNRPAAPVVTFADQGLLVQWTPPVSDGTPIGGYELTIGGGLNDVQPLGNLTSFLWTGLTNGVNYQFSVVAINAFGRSQPSAFSNVEHPLREPDAPGAPAAGRGNRYLDLSWSQPATNGDPVIEYQVERQSNPGVYATATTASMRWSDLPNGVDQQFRVRARNRDPQWGAWSGWSAPQRACGQPDTPAAPSAARGDKQASVTFGAPGDQGCAIDQYRIETDGGQQLTVNGSPATFGGLTNGTAYRFRVQAHNSEGWSSWSDYSGAVTPAGAPVGPDAVKATVSDVGRVQLDWAAANSNGSALTGYEYSVDNGPAKSAGASTAHAATGLSNATTYSFRVRACNAVGCGAWSASDSATTWGSPDQVAQPAVSAGNAALTASWSAPSANGSAIDHYEVDVSPGGVVNEQGRSRAFNNLTNGSTYSIRVRACNAVGCGPWSAGANGTPKAPTSVTLSKGPRVSRPDCSTSGCAWFRIDATGFAPNTSYRLSCHGAVGGEFITRDLTTDSSGELHTASNCYYGYSGAAWVVFGGVKSNEVSW